MEILYPMFGMIFITAMVMMLLYISRIQALSNRSKNPNRLPNEVARHSDEIRKYMTPRNRFITENYNHLFEQPTLFYAVVIYIFLMGNSLVFDIIRFIIYKNNVGFYAQLFRSVSRLIVDFLIFAIDLNT